MTRVVSVVCLAAMLGVASHPAAQSPAGPAFEVASIKPGDPGATGPLGGPPLPLVRPVAGGRFSASNVTLRDLVRRAYDSWFDLQIAGGPEWQSSRRFDIQAKAEDPNTSLDAMRPMLRALLADRFQLKVHTEMREMPIYTLVVAREDGRPGARVTPSAADCANAAQEQAELVRAGGVAERLRAGQGMPCSIMPVPASVAGTMTMRANSSSMADLASFLTPFTGRMVLDRTGLGGLYDWEMTFDRGIRPVAAQPGSNLPPAAPASDSPPLMIAIEEQLGLKLESGRGPIEVLVIDSAALPTPD